MAYREPVDSAATESQHPSPGKSQAQHPINSKLMMPQRVIPGKCTSSPLISTDPKTLLRRTRLQSSTWLSKTNGGKKLRLMKS